MECSDLALGCRVGVVYRFVDFLLEYSGEGVVAFWVLYVDDFWVSVIGVVWRLVGEARVFSGRVELS